MPAITTNDLKNGITLQLDNGLFTVVDFQHALVMHPGPMNRGVEIAADVADLPRAVITQQVRNGVAVRMAILYSLLGAGADLG